MKLWLDVFSSWERDKEGSVFAIDDRKPKSLNFLAPFGQILSFGSPKTLKILYS